jgi:hypothetical protein
VEASGGRVVLEAEGPFGSALTLESSRELERWAEVQTLTGQGEGQVLRFTLPTPSTDNQFWRIRNR